MTNYSDSSKGQPTLKEKSDKLDIRKNYGDAVTFFNEVDRQFEEKPGETQYEYAMRFVEVVEKILKKDQSNDELDETKQLRQYLLHEIRMYYALMYRGKDIIAMMETVSFEDEPISQLINDHKALREQYLSALTQDVKRLESERAIKAPLYIRTLNFYLLEIYKQFGIDEATALELVSRLVDMPTEKLIKLKLLKDSNSIPGLSTDNFTSLINRL